MKQSLKYGSFQLILECIGPARYQALGLLKKPLLDGRGVRNPFLTPDFMRYVAGKDEQWTSSAQRRMRKIFSTTPLLGIAEGMAKKYFEEEMSSNKIKLTGYASCAG